MPHEPVSKREVHKVADGLLEVANAIAAETKTTPQDVLRTLTRPFDAENPIWRAWRFRVSQAAAEALNPDLPVTGLRACLHAYARDEATRLITEALQKAMNEARLVELSPVFGLAFGELKTRFGDAFERS
jgi:hypothetical protein